MPEPGTEEEKARLSESDSANVHIDMDDSTAKFLSNGGAGNKTTHEDDEKSEASFTGLGKEELMKYADDPFWRKTRLILLIAFWVGWIGMLVAAIVIIVLAPRCPYRPDQKWFDQEAVYQVYPKSFKDTTQDAADEGAGIGDLQGVVSKLSYIESLGMKSIYLNSFLKSGNEDSGMDVVSYTEIDPAMGVMADFDQLRKLTKNKMMHIILDFIPNHTSKKHPWFEASQKKEGEYANYYIWAQCDKNNPAVNDWKNNYGQSVWTYDDVRGECYLHQYLESEPDLNLRNPAVLQALKTAMNFWLEKGVDGFVIQGAERLVENGLNNTDSADDDATVAFLTELRTLADSFATKPGKERALIVSASGALNETSKFFGTEEQKAATFMVLNPLDDVGSDYANGLMDFINRVYGTSSDSKKYALTLGNQDTTRLASKVGAKLVKAMLAVQMLLKGMPINFYGTEIGMMDGKVGNDKQVDPLRLLGKGRDGFRTPMPWDSSANSGFSSHNPWLPVSNNSQINVKAQNAYYSDQVFDETVLHAFIQLSHLRTNESFQWGQTKVGVKDEVLWFSRHAEGFPGYLVVINLSQSPKTLSLHEATGEASTAEQVFHSHMSTDTTKLDLKEKSVAIGVNHVLVLKHS